VECLKCKGIELENTVYKGLNIDRCPKCGSIWIEEDKLREFKDKTDEFLCWLNIDLWEHLSEHKVNPAGIKCPSCSQHLFNVDYKGSHIVLPVCFSCKGVWLSEETKKSLFEYLDSILTTETIAGFLKDIGHEAIDFVSGKETLKEEMRDLKTILILIEYRIFSKFPALEKFISGFPK